MFPLKEPRPVMHWYPKGEVLPHTESPLCECSPTLDARGWHHHVMAPGYRPRHSRPGKLSWKERLRLLIGT